MVAPKYEKRNRVNYGNEFLYTSFDATGYHFNDQTLILAANCGMSLGPTVLAI